MVFSVFSWASVEVIVVVNWATGVLRPVRRTGGFCVLCRVVRRNWTVLSWVGGVCGGAVGCGVVVHGTVGVLMVGGVGTRAVRRRVVGVGRRAVGIGIVGISGFANPPFVLQSLEFMRKRLSLMLGSMYFWS